MTSPFGLEAKNVSNDAALGTCVDCFKNLQTPQPLHTLVLRCGLLRLLRWKAARSSVRFIQEDDAVKDVLLHILAAFEAVQLRSPNAESENANPSSFRDRMAAELLFQNILELARQLDDDTSPADEPNMQAPALDTVFLEPLLTVARLVNTVEDMAINRPSDTDTVENAQSKKVSTTRLEQLMSIDNIVSHMDQVASDRFSGVSLVPEKTGQMFCDESEFGDLISRIAELLVQLESLLPQREILRELVEAEIVQIRAKPSLELLMAAAEHIDPILHSAAKEALDSERYLPIVPSRWNVDDAGDNLTPQKKDPIKASPRTKDELSVYTPLSSKHNKIRVLEILPGELGTTVSVKLIESQITDCSYEALSYTWGDGVVGPTIELNGKSFRVTENLERCLQHIRQKDRTRYLWVDAVCINQEDVNERNAQVRQMGNIYASAAGVVVWLDMDIDLGQPAFAKLLQVTDFTDLGKNGTFWNPVVDIFNHPYWFRLWIQQELVLCKKYEVNCRSSIIPGHCVSDFLLHTKLLAIMEQSQEEYKNFTPLAHAIESITDVPSKNLGVFQRRLAERSPVKFRLSQFRDRLVRRMKRRNCNDIALEDCRLLRCLSDFQNTLQVTNPRDRVFGILSLTTDCSPKSIKIDYCKSVAEVYRDSAYYIYRRYGSLDFLCVVERFRENNNNSHDLPSWLPDWNRSLYSNSPWGRQTYRASGDLRPRSKAFSGDGRALKVRGVKIGNVLKSDQWEPGRKPIARHVATWNHITEAAKASFGVEDGMTWFAEQLRLVMGAHSHGVLAMCQKDHVIMDIVTFCLLAILPPYMGMEFCEFVPSQEVCNVRPVYQNIYHYMAGILPRRELFLTDKGWLGMVSEGTVQEGDEVWILFGCSMPMLLRPHDAYHEVVAPVAAPGVMEGEIVKTLGRFQRGGKETDQYEVRSIELR
ncbi:hypothetical protein ACEPPN_019207 [Leptodophora sp. 'Broadleaf-Isolate-01']